MGLFGDFSKSCAKERRKQRGLGSHCWAGSELVLEEVEVELVLVEVELVVLVVSSLTRADREGVCH